MPNNKFITIILGNNDKESPVLQPKLWGEVEFFGMRGVIYRIRRTEKENGRGTTLSIKACKVSKYKWKDNLKLYWLKTRVKFNWI